MNVRNSVHNILACVIVNLSFCFPVIADRAEPDRECFVDVDVTVAGWSQGSDQIQATLTAGGSVGHPKELQFSLWVPGDVKLSLPCGPWEIRLEAQGYWGESKSTTTDSEVLELDLLPSGVIMGRLSPPEGGEVPLAVETRFTALTLGDSLLDNTVRDGLAQCVVQGREFRCELPAGVADVRVHSTPYAPVYLWGTRLEAGEAKDVGLLQLVPGASLVGWVIDADGHSQENVHIEVHPPDPPQSGFLPDAQVTDHQNSRLFTAKTNERGFFQLLGLEEGSFDLKARKEGFAETTLSLGVTLVADLETELANPVVLYAPTVYEVSVDPPFDVWGESWDLRLLPPVQTMEKLGYIMTNLGNGNYRLEGADPGSYELKVRSSREKTWWSEDVQLHPGETTPRFVQISIVEVTGTVEFDDEPFPGRVGFRGRSYAVIDLAIDEEGQFSGFLPSEGPYGVDVSPEDDPEQVISLKTELVEAGPSGVAKLALTVPGTRLEGEVVDGSGNPIGDVEVLAYGKSSNPTDYLEENGRLIRLKTFSSRTETASDGTFLFRGLAPEEYEVRAETRDGEMTSRPERIRIIEDLEPSRLHLVLRSHRRVSGLVWSDSGPVPGAILTTWPDELKNIDQVSSPEMAMSDADGSFVFKIRDDFDSVNVMIYAPGYGLILRREVIPQDESLILHLEKAAGRLILDVPPYRSGDVPRSYGVLHDGGFFNYLVFRAALNKMQPGAVELERVAPGIYSLCEYRSALAALSQGKDPSNFCVTGVVAPESDLVLSVKEPS